MIKGKVTGHAALLSKMKKISAGAMGVVTDGQLERLLVKRVLQRFDRAESPEGEKWPALRSRWAKRKRGNKLLKHTGALRDSIDVVKRSAGSLASATGLGFAIGVNPNAVGYRGVPVTVYARTHQFGEAPQDRRRFLGISELDVRSARDFVSRRLDRLVAG